MLGNFIFSNGGRNEWESVNIEGEAWAISLLVGRWVQLSCVEGPGRGSFRLEHREKGWELWMKLKSELSLEPDYPWIFQLYKPISSLSPTASLSWFSIFDQEAWLIVGRQQIMLPKRGRPWRWPCHWTLNHLETTCSVQMRSIMIIPYVQPHTHPE